jgi:hypothetical protein
LLAAGQNQHNTGLVASVVYGAGGRSAAVRKKMVSMRDPVRSTMPARLKARANRGSGGAVGRRAGCRGVLSSEGAGLDIVQQSDTSHGPRGGSSRGGSRRLANPSGMRPRVIRTPTVNILL